MKSSLSGKKDSDSKTRLLHSKKIVKTRINKKLMMKMQTWLLRTTTKLIERKRSRELPANLWKSR
jgi:hypothetical protein